MRFFIEDNYITCLPDKPSENSGYDSQNNFVKLNTHTLHFNHILAENQLPHADIIALICLIVFYPFLKTSHKITFPFNISNQFVNILAKHKLTTNVNIDHKLFTYNHNHNYSLQSKRVIALSWGGGLDSWAVYRLQPELYTVLIHEEQEESPLPENDPLSLPLVKVSTNNRQIASNNDEKDAGWTTWVSVLVTTLWLSQEYNINTVALGGNLGSLFLQDGKQYYPAHVKPNLWFETFRLLGMELYLPLGGLTDLGVIKIISNDFLSKFKYCWRSNQLGENCHQCLKCLRKEVLLGKDIDQGEVLKHAFTGPSFEYLKTRNENLAQWVEKYYQPAFILIPSDMRNQLQRVLLNYVELLPKNLEFLVEHYGWI